MSDGRLFHAAGSSGNGECTVGKVKSGARDDEVSTGRGAESDASRNR